VTMPDSPSDRARAAWRTLSSRPVYANPWIRVREDVAELPDGRTTLYGVVECAPCVGVLPFLDARTVVLVGQWRYVARAFTWEMPTGAMQPGESAEAAVQRELGEEAGYEAVRDHAEARRKERLRQRHLHLPAVAEGSANPWKLGRPSARPSEAKTVVSPTRKLACITLFRHRAGP